MAYSSYAVTKMILALHSISSSKSNPDLPGICMSRNIKSGFNFSINSFVSSTVSDSPMISISLKSFNNAFKSSLASSSSSTIIDLKVVFILTPCKSRL